MVDLPAKHWADPSRISRREKDADTRNLLAPKQPDRIEVHRKNGSGMATAPHRPHAHQPAGSAAFGITSAKGRWACWFCGRNVEARKTVFEAAIMQLAVFEYRVEKFRVRCFRLNATGWLFVQTAFGGLGLVLVGGHVGMFRWCWRRAVSAAVRPAVRAWRRASPLALVFVVRGHVADGLVEPNRVVFDADPFKLNGKDGRVFDGEEVRVLRFDMSP